MIFRLRMLIIDDLHFRLNLSSRLRENKTIQGKAKNW